jgi:predicted Zn-dependent peptidase
MHKNLVALPNGLKVLTINIPSAESVAISLVGRAGTLYEQVDALGVAHFLEHVVFDATRDYPDEQSLTSLIEDIGGIRGGMTNKEIVEYWVKILPEHIENAFIYLSQITLHPLLKEKDIIKHKGIIEQEINRDIADPERYAPRAAYSILFPFQAIGALTTGDVEDIHKIQRSTLESFLSQRYTAENFILVAAGKVDAAQITEMAEKYFSEMKSASTKSVTLQPNYQKELLVQKRPNIAQTALQLSYHGFHQDEQHAVAADFIAALLSHGKLSRLKKKIRDELGLAYMIHAHHNKGLQFGLFSIYSGLAEKNIPAYLQAMKDECDKILDYDIPQEEWNKTLALLESEFKFGFENTTQVARYYARTNIHRDAIKDHSTLLEQFRALTQQDVRTCAREIFSQEPKIVAVGGNVYKELFE